MENNNLNEEIIKNVRNRIVMSNIEREEIMKINKRKSILTIIVAAIIFSTGGLVTVNAATNGAVVDKIKDVISIVFTDKDGKTEKIDGTSTKDSNNHTIEKYTKEKDGSNYEIEIDKTELENNNSQLDGNINEEGIDINIKDNK